MKRKGCSIIFFNDQGQILLFLRDDIPDIPYPNMWDIPGGHVEDSESPEQCIVREMKEEMGLNLQAFEEFKIVEFADRMEYVFWKKKNLDINKIELTEGQCLKWFTEDDIRNTNLAYGFNQVAQDFFRKKK
ncbi:MAG: NUDIX hydrolase [Desulfobacteraceae bacterium]|nr:NUDIX hydrolase [Desulfobacteraceae bacterium]